MYKQFTPQRGGAPLHYICIDATNNAWDVWKRTTHFIVDAYHYNNHSVLDILCRTWCNPAPSDGSAPNLVIIA
jgi:hypothetical protein